MKMRIAITFLFLAPVIGLLQDKPASPAKPTPAEEIKTLVRQLGDDNFSIREKASQRLTAIGRPALPALRQAAKDSDAEVRQRAGQILDAIQSSLTFLLESLKDNNPAVRREAAQGLIRLGPKAKPAVTALTQALQDKDEDVRDAVFNALLSIDPEIKALVQEVPKKAQADKYHKLLRRIRVPQDRKSYTEFSDYGFYDGSEWAGYTDLPPGYWVYVYPHWYIWAEVKESK
jgi:HEAT repeat protein